MTTRPEPEPGIEEVTDLRRRIDDIDRGLVDLINERMRAAAAIGRLKQRHDTEVYVPAREKQVLEAVRQLNRGPIPPESLEAIYREIFSAALAVESGVRVAYFGSPATFTHQAARSRFGASVEYVACETIADVFASVAKRESHYGVVPVENSIEGAVTHTLDLFTETRLRICAEILLPVSHHLLSRTTIDKVSVIYSHPQVLGQCRRWLQKELPRAELIPVTHTARAAELAAMDANAAHSAAIASALAAGIYGLDVLARELQDFSGNVTRFLVIARTFGPSTGDDKTSLMFLVKHEVGALYNALECFSKNGLNMTKIESRPHKTRAWEYYFFVDFEGHAEDESARRALSDLRAHCLTMTVLGSYPKTPLLEA